MSILQYPDSIDAPNLQIWNNAAFDDAGGTNGSIAKISWFPLQPISINRSESLDLDSSKENRSPTFPKSPKNSLGSIKKPLKQSRNTGIDTNDAQIDDTSIDSEIEEIEKEIGRLSSRLEALRIKKAEKDLRISASRRRGRIVPAKFMSSVKNLETPALKKIEESPASTKFRRRGISLGPSEISNSIRFQRLDMPDVTPIQSAQNRRKSCFWKVNPIEEEEVEGKGRRRSMSSSPKSRRSIAKASEPRLGIDATGSKKLVASPANPANVRFRRMGTSLGPLEMSDITPLRSASQNRRKSCFWKADTIEVEEKVLRKERRRSMSSSPKSRRSIANASKPRLTTVATGSKKASVTPANPANVRFRQRGMSLGPSEICTGSRLHQPRKLQEIKVDEGVKPKRGRCLSMSPKYRRQSVAKVSDLRKGIMTVGSKKPVKRGEDGLLASLQPKSLFQEDKNSVTGKRPSKNRNARVVASRYSLVTGRTAGDETGNKRRKWSLPEPDKEASDESEKIRSLSVGESCVLILDSSLNQGMESQMEKQSEIPSKAEGKGICLLSVEKSPPSIMKITGLLPKIKTFRCTDKSPRDSGCAKRVAELVGRRSHFGVTECEAATSTCQILGFEGEEL